jgi:hypothetical protein
MAAAELIHGLAPAEYAEFKALSQMLFIDLTPADLDRYGELRAKLNVTEGDPED